MTWELAGKYPNILEDKVVGETAQKLFDEANDMLDQIIKEKWLTANAVFGLWPANSKDNEIEIYTDSSKGEVLATQYCLRQQTKKSAKAHNMSLADFIAPVNSGKEDYIGGFVVTTGLNIEKKLKEFEADHDDYSSIMLKALADRLAEAFAEYLHQFVRDNYWGYDKNKTFSNEELIKEKYRGIRPAPGYPACPDHTEKTTLFEMLDATKITGVSLTESLAMMPAASVSGWFFANPEAKYFGIQKIREDQIKDIAERKGKSYEEMEKWLRSLLD